MEDRESVETYQAADDDFAVSRSGGRSGCGTFSNSFGLGGLLDATDRSGSGGLSLGCARRPVARSSTAPATGAEDFVERLVEFARHGDSYCEKSWFLVLGVGDRFSSLCLK